MIKRIFSLLVLLGAATVGNVAGAADASKPIDLFVGTQPFTTVFVAERRGYFAKHGVNVQVHRFSSGTGATEAFRAADAGVFVAGDMPSILSWQHGDVVGIAPISSDTTTFSIVVNSKIKSPADLEGKKLATVKGSTGDVFLQAYMDKNNIDASKVEILNLGPGSFIAALLKGEIDGFAWLGPEAAAALNVVEGSRLLQDGTEGYLVNHIIVSATKDLLATNRQEVIGVVQALLEAQKETREHPDQAAADVSHITGMKEAQARADVDRITYDMTLTKAFMQEMDDIVNVAYKAGILKSQTDVSAAFDRDVLKAISNSLVEDN